MEDNFLILDEMKEFSIKKWTDVAKLKLKTNAINMCPSLKRQNQYENAVSVNATNNEISCELFSQRWHENQDPKSL